MSGNAGYTWALVEVKELAPLGPLFEQCRARKKKQKVSKDEDSKRLSLLLPSLLWFWRAVVVKDHGSGNASVSLLSNSLGKQATACNLAGNHSIRRTTCPSQLSLFFLWLLLLSLARTVDGLLWHLHVRLSNLGSLQQTTLVKFASNGDAILSCCEAERILGLVCCLVVFGSVGQSLDVFPFGGPNGLRTNCPPS